MIDPNEIHNLRREVNTLKSQMRDMKRILQHIPTRVPLVQAQQNRIIFGELDAGGIAEGFNSGTMIQWSFDENDDLIISLSDPEDRLEVWDIFGAGLPGYNGTTRTIVIALKNTVTAKWFLVQACVVDATLTGLPAYP